MANKRETTKTIDPREGSKRITLHPSESTHIAKFVSGQRDINSSVKNLILLSEMLFPGIDLGHDVLEFHAKLDKLRALDSGNLTHQPPEELGEVVLDDPGVKAAKSVNEPSSKKPSAPKTNAKPVEGGIKLGAMESPGHSEEDIFEMLQAGISDEMLIDDGVSKSTIAAVREKYNLRKK